MMKFYESLSHIVVASSAELWQLSLGANHKIGANYTNDFQIEIQIWWKKTF